MPWDSQILCLNTSNFFQKTTHHYPSISCWTIFQKKPWCRKKHKSKLLLRPVFFNPPSTSSLYKQPTNQPRLLTSKLHALLGVVLRQNKLPGVAPFNDIFVILPKRCHAFLSYYLMERKSCTTRDILKQLWDSPCPLVQDFLHLASMWQKRSVERINTSKVGDCQSVVASHPSSLPNLRNLDTWACLEFLLRHFASTNFLFFWRWKDGPSLHPSPTSPTRSSDFFSNTLNQRSFLKAQFGIHFVWFERVNLLTGILP